jgi:hypothetical protein
MKPNPLRALKGQKLSVKERKRRYRAALTNPPKGLFGLAAEYVKPELKRKPK